MFNDVGRFSVAASYSSGGIFQQNHRKSGCVAYALMIGIAQVRVWR
jgi:hypothetical protein